MSTERRVISSEDLLGNFTIDLNGCARCGGEHKQLLFRKLQRPVDHGGGVTDTHWATCPTTGEPILLFTQDAP